MCDATSQETASHHRRFQPYPEYKDSGVEWLGRIPAHWKSKRLKFISIINMGQSPPSEIVNTLEEGLPFLQGNADFGAEHPTARTFCPAPSKIAKLRDILLSVRAPVGALNIADHEYGIGRGLCAIRPNIKILEQGFCQYVLQIARHQLDEVAKGSTYDAVSAQEISCLLIPLPSIKEQRAIVAFLNPETKKIDALIEKKERLMELLQEKRTALITQAVTKGLDPNVPMKDSGVEWLGRIPEHWEVKRLRHIGMALIGLTYEPADVVGPDEGVLVLRASNVCDGRIVLEDNVFVKRSIPDRLITKVGDILICARSGSRALIGKSAKIDRAFVGLTFGTFMMVFRSNCNDYLFYAFNSTLFNYQSGAFLTSTINQLTLSNLISFKVPVPPFDERSAIAAFLEYETAKIDSLVIKIQEAIQRLKEYRTALISAAVTGKIDVRGIIV